MYDFTYFIYFTKRISRKYTSILPLCNSILYRYRILSIIVYGEKRFSLERNQKRTIHNIFYSNRRKIKSISFYYDLRSAYYTRIICYGSIRLENGEPRPGRRCIVLILRV